MRASTRLSALTATVAIAAWVPSAPAAAKPKHAAVAAAAPAGPPIDVKVSLAEAGPDAKWELKLENTSGTPARVVDDMRYLWLEVKKPGQARARACKLPPDMVPALPPERHVRELPPGESLVKQFDPRFFCFSPARQEILVPSAQVTPHYGFPRKPRVSWVKGKRVESFDDVEPFIAEPLDTGAAGPRKELVGDPIILDPRYAAWAGTPGEDGEDEEEPEAPELAMLRGSDAKTEIDVTAVVRVRNPMKHKLVIFLRRELLTFEVLTPHGSVDCEAEPDERNPDPRAFRSVRPGGSVSLTSRLVELCARGTFAEQGLYLVNAELRAPASGREYGLDAFTGTLHTPMPALVRVRHAIEVPRNRPMRPGGVPGGAPQVQQVVQAAQPAPPPMVVPPPMPPPPPPQ